MVRPSYRLNETVGPLPIFKPGENDEDLRGFKAPKSNWAIDWRRFTDTEPLDYGTLVDNPDQNDQRNRNRLQLAYRESILRWWPRWAVCHDRWPQPPDVSCSAKSGARMENAPPEWTRHCQGDGTGPATG